LLTSFFPSLLSYLLLPLQEPGGSSLQPRCACACARTHAHTNKQTNTQNVI